MTPQPSSHTPSTLPVTEKSSKGRLLILDGLRGVAALIVVAYHIFDSDPVNPVNHGYLAVDFFFMLSGYVMGYAYDERWKMMSIGYFLKRRFIRLHPMVVIGTIIGAFCFYFSASSLFGLVNQTSFGMLVISSCLGVLLIPSLKSMDVRGWGESYPLNGPMWSLFFEYIGNMAYALWLRKLSRFTLGILLAVLGILMTYMAVSGKTGSVAYGWLFTQEHVFKGILRMLFPFVAGLFLFRLGKTLSLKHAMIFTSLLLITALLMPRVGPDAKPWVNGLYECFVIIILLPIIVMIGAGSKLATSFGGKVCHFLGELSYPLYLAHYPILYVFYGWLSNTKPAWNVKIPAAIGAYSLCILTGWVIMRFVDTPIRKRLAGA